MMSLSQVPRLVVWALIAVAGALTGCVSPAPVPDSTQSPPRETSIFVAGGGDRRAPAIVHRLESSPGSKANLLHVETIQLDSLGIAMDLVSYKGNLVVLVSQGESGETIRSLVYYHVGDRWSSVLWSSAPGEIHYVATALSAVGNLMFIQSGQQAFCVDLTTHQGRFVEKVNLHPDFRIQSDGQRLYYIDAQGLLAAYSPATDSVVTRALARRPDGLLRVTDKGILAAYSNSPRWALWSAGTFRVLPLPDSTAPGDGEKVTNAPSAEFPADAFEVHGRLFVVECFDKPSTATFVSGTKNVLRLRSPFRYCGQACVLDIAN